MTHTFVDGEHEVCRMEHQIISARFDRFSFEFFDGLVSGLLGLVHPGIGFDILVADLLWPSQRTPLLEIASGGVDRRDIELWKATNEILLDAGAVTGSEKLLLIDK